ncbi:MAG: PAS domain-containing sensor histidine kinase [Myxococcota bacterium]
MGKPRDLEEVSLHRTLQRQLRKFGIDPETGPPDAETWARFLARVDATYRSTDEERYTAQRALEISSREMEALSRQIAADRERLAQMIESLPQAVVYTDAELLVQFCNAQASDLLGEVSAGAHLDSLVDLLDAHGHAIEVAGIVGRGLGETSGAVEGGFGRIEAAWQLVPIVVDQRLDGVLLVVHDLREVRAAELALHEARMDAHVSRETEVARGRFLANVSHELRTPLNAILGYTEMLQEEAANGEAEDLSRILHAGRHLLALINDLLDLSKIDAGKMELVLEPVHLDEVLSEVAATAGPLVARHGNVLVVEDAVCTPVAADAMRLRQCLLNLVGNAAKFTHEGTIRIATRERDGAVWIDVIDTGRGIPAHRLAGIFDAFEQVKPEEHQGTGLGLALTRAFVQLMGGHIQVTSAVDVGSTFSLVLPRSTGGS